MGDKLCFSQFKSEIAQYHDIYLSVGNELDSMRMSVRFNKANLTICGRPSLALKNDESSVFLSHIHNIYKKNFEAGCCYTIECLGIEKVPTFYKIKCLCCENFC